MMADVSKVDGSIAMHFVREAIRVARARGIDVERILLASDIESAFVDLDFARVTPQHYGRMWLLLAEQMDDEFFGMDSHAVRAGSFALACRCALGATSLEHALHRFTHFYRVAMDDLWPSVERRDGRACLVLTSRAGTPRPFALCMMFVILIGVSSWLAGRRIPITDVEFGVAVTDHVDEYRMLFGAATRFDGTRTFVAFDETFLDLPVIRDAASLAVFLHGAPSNILRRYRDRGSVSARIRQHLRGIDVAEWPDFTGVANAMHVAERTLFRRLSAEGRSYQHIKDELRRDMAVHLLGNSTLGIGDIAAQLGFSEPSAFHRAFRKWTGEGPGAYRATVTKG